MRDQQTPPTDGGTRVLPPIRVRRALPPGAVRRGLTRPPPPDRAVPAAADPAEVPAEAPGGWADERPGGWQAGPAQAADATGGRVAGPAGQRPAGGGPGWGGHGAPRPGGGATRVAVPARRRVSVPIAAGTAVAVLAAVVAAAGLLTGGDSGGDDRPRLTVEVQPPALVLRTKATGTEQAGDPPTPGIPLPDGPRRGRVRELPPGAASEEQVLRLAVALGVPGRPERTPNGWALGGLRVSDAGGHPWELTTPAGDPPVVVLPGAPDSPVSGPARGGGRRPDPRLVRRAAAPVLAAIGLDGAALRFAGATGALDVVADPVIDGLPTAGMATWLRYAPGARLVGAAGWLGSLPTDGPTYPLVSAEEALATLGNGQEIAPQCPGLGCGPRTVTAAEPGLVLRHDTADRALLVPAWLFTVGVRDPARLAAVAVSPAFLPEPAADPRPPAPSADDSAATSDGSTGNPGPAGTPAPPRPTS